MIDNVHFSYKNGNLITYKKDNKKCGVPYSLIKQIWGSLTIQTIEGWRWKVINNYIAFVILVAQGQGGILFVWDTDSETFVHYSEASYCKDFLLLSNNKIVTLHLVTNFVTPYHIQMWECEFGTKNRFDAGQRLYCKHPVSFDDADLSNEEMIIDISNKQLVVHIGSHTYLYSDDIQKIETQTPNPKFDYLYKKWENQLDPEKVIIRGMIT